MISASAEKKSYPSDKPNQRPNVERKGNLIRRRYLKNWPNSPRGFRKKRRKKGRVRTSAAIENPCQRLVALQFEAASIRAIGTRCGTGLRQLRGRYLGFATTA